MSRQPLVSCRACRFQWHSAAMADGLKVLGRCPRCGGDLDFAEHAIAQEPSVGDSAAEKTPATEPHLVLGVPRR